MRATSLRAVHPARQVPPANTCVVLRMGLLRLFHGKADIVDLVSRPYHGASGWGTARFDAAIQCLRYGPSGDMIAAGAAVGPPAT